MRRDSSVDSKRELANEWEFGIGDVSEADVSEAGGTGDSAAAGRAVRIVAARMTTIDERMNERMESVEAFMTLFEVKRRRD